MFPDGEVYENYELRLGGTQSDIEGAIQVKLQHEMIWRTLCFSREFIVSHPRLSEFVCLFLFVCLVFTLGFFYSRIAERVLILPAQSPGGGVLRVG